jgi:hypothetical protein
MLFQFFLHFHYQFVKELKQSISDSRNLKDIALKNKWEQCSEWDIDKLIETRL